MRTVLLESIGVLDTIVLTKRIILSVISSWYDHLGLICPVTIKFKIKLS